jgi:uncharacterized protein YcaQ
MTLRAQGLLGATPWRASRAGVSAMLRQVGAVQLDTISVLARSHELVAYARLGPVAREQIEQAYWPPGAPLAFEYWAHAACVLPLEQWPYFAFRRRAFAARGLRWHQSHAETCEKVLARLRAEGPLTAAQLGGAKAGGPWWDWSEVKIAVEWLLDMGEVICVRRAGWRRVYDLPERVLPAELRDRDPTDLECLTYLAAVAARALGVVSHADLVDYHRLSFPARQGTFTGMAADAAQAAGLVPVTLTGPAGGPGRGSPARDSRGWADPAALARASERGRHRVTLLSPFDSLVWDRKRTLRMFGFQHSLEAYVPRHKRVHGYYTMPLLAGGWLAGRVDPGREGRTLVARKVSLERASAAEPMAQALREAATWVGCDDVRLEQVEPPGHAARLAAALRLPAGPGSAELDELPADGDHHGFHPGVDLEFLQDVPDVVLHRVLGDEQLLGDVAVVHAAGDQLEDLHLPLGELGRGDVLSPVLGGVPVGQGGELGDELARHGRVDQRLAAMHRAHRLGHLVQRDVLEQVAAGAGPDRLEQVLFLVADGQHHDLGAGGDLLGRPAGLDPAGLRHPDVHEHDVGQRLARHGDRLGAVAGLADQVDVVLVGQDHLQAAPEQRMIVGDQDPDRLGATAGVGPLRGSHRSVAVSAQFVASLGTGSRRKRLLPTRGHDASRPGPRHGLP